MSGAGYGSTGGANRDSAGLNAGTTGSHAMGDRAGSGEVHSGLHSGGQRNGYSGAAGGQTSEGLRGKASDAADAVRERASEVGERASGAASQAKGRLGAMGERATSALEGRGVLARLQENPLPALGVAFAVGFLVAGGTNAGSRPNSPASRARQELRNALMAGASAGMAQGARGFLDTAGRPEGFANTFLRSLLSNVLGGAQGGAQGGSQGGRPQGGPAGARPQGMSGGGQRPPSSGSRAGGY